MHEALKEQVLQRRLLNIASSKKPPELEQWESKQKAALKAATAAVSTATVLPAAAEAAAAAAAVSTATVLPAAAATVEAAAATVGTVKAGADALGGAAKAGTVAAPPVPPTLLGFGSTIL